LGDEHNNLRRLRSSLTAIKTRTNSLRIIFSPQKKEKLGCKALKKDGGVLTLKYNYINMLSRIHLCSADCWRLIG